MAKPNHDLLSRAADAAREVGEDVKATALDAVAILFAKEVARCLDPRHSTTMEQADAAVADSWPFDNVIRELKEETDG